jgi:Tripartite tricarboxylate transporter TctB family
MEPSQPTDAAHRAGPPTYLADAVVALIVFAFGAIVLEGSWKLGSGWTSDGPGAGYFPFYIGIILCVAGAGIFVQALFGKTKDREIFVDREQLGRVLSVLVPALVYVFAVQYIGLYVASAIYIAGFMIVLGKYSPLKSVITALIINALFFAMFEIWFKVPLFKGSLDPTGFLGY